MDTPQEVEVWYILPALRKLFAIELKKTGLKQNQIAKALNITEAAVSQYLTKKRGEEIKFPKQIEKEVSVSVKKILDNKTNFRYEFQRILNIINEAKFICTVCHGHTRAEKACEICYTR
jgi:uncharacterized protein